MQSMVHITETTKIHDEQKTENGIKSAYKICSIRWAISRFEICHWQPFDRIMLMCVVQWNVTINKKIFHKQLYIWCSEMHLPIDLTELFIQSIGYLLQCRHEFLFPSLFYHLSNFQSIRYFNTSLIIVESIFETADIQINSKTSKCQCCPVHSMKQRHIENKYIYIYMRKNNRPVEGK